MDGRTHHVLFAWHHSCLNAGNFKLWECCSVLVKKKKVSLELNFHEAIVCLEAVLKGIY